MQGMAYSYVEIMHKADVITYRIYLPMDNVTVGSTSTSVCQINL